jgi:uncharacterized protein with ATP-grasp and redox domains
VKTYLECIPCFFRQALEAAGIVGANEGTKREIMNRVAAEIPNLSLAATPPEMGEIVYSIVAELVGDGDPYLELKRRSTRLCMEVYDELKARVAKSDDPLRLAAQLAIAGNIIDYGAKRGLDVRSEVERILASERLSTSDDGAFFAFDDFAAELARARTILYLGDNAGETVFDRILIEEILRLYPDKEVTYAVKERPTINDALIEDARDCGLDRMVRVVSSGSTLPGTVLDRCSEEFREMFARADMVVSKGQGNFETLSEAERPVFFLFIAKCRVVERGLGCSMGDVILMRGGA